jgi:hypothetical protein
LECGFILSLLLASVGFTLGLVFVEKRRHHFRRFWLWFHFGTTRHQLGSGEGGDDQTLLHLLTPDRAELP